MEFEATIILSAQSYDEPIISALNNIETNNISLSLSQISGLKDEKSSPFLLGETEFGYGNTYSKDSNSFYIADFVEDFQINVSTQSQYVIIYFDTANWNYPQSVTVGTTQYSPKSPALVIDMSEFGGTTTITMSNWKKPLPFIRIEGISNFRNFEIGNGEITNINFTGSSRSDYLLPSWGVVSNSGSIRIKDKYRILESLQRIGVDAAPEISLKYLVRPNSYTVHPVIFGIFWIEDFTPQYSSDHTCSLNFTDRLSEWRSMSIPSFEISDLPETSTIIDILSQIYEIAYEIDENYVGFGLDDSLTILSDDVTLEKVHWEKGSLWNVLAQICDGLGLYIYRTANSQTATITTERGE